jgi:antibiotic biosynthesis monooxygenase (ABM) superfamily enzyme
LTVVVTWWVQHGREQEFEALHREISAAALKFPGHMGINVMRPNGPDQKYVVIFRFDTYAHLLAWQESDIRRDLLKKAEAFQKHEPTYHLQTGLEYWFSAPGVPVTPPRWKMVLVTILGVWPLSMLVPWFLNPLVANLYWILKALLIAVGIVVVLTWVVMPILVKVLKPWLQHRT